MVYREQKVTFHNAAAADGNGQVVPTAGFSAVGIQIKGASFVSTVYFEATIDGTNWVGVLGTNCNTGEIATSSAAEGLWQVPLLTYRRFRARLDWTSGTATVTGIFSEGDVEPLADVYLAAGGNLIGTVQPFSALLQGGLTELVGINEEVNTSDYGGSVGVALGGTYSGEMLGFTFYATEDGSGAVHDSAGTLIIFDADPSISAGDTAMTAAERVTVIAQVDVLAADWQADANGASAYIYDQPVPFHALSTIYFVWFHTDATDLNDGAGDDEQLQFDFWYRRDS